MPFIEQPDVTPREPGLLVPEPKPEVTTLGVLGAAARDENLMVSAYNYLTERSGFVNEPDHNPLDVIGSTKYEAAHLNRFVGSRSAAETQAIMSRIDREESDDRLLDAAGWGGTVARIGMGILDPTLFIPFGAYYKTGRAASTIGKSALGLSAGAAGQAAISESVLYATQETRTPAEVAGNVGGAAILGGILGGAIGAMTAKEVADATKALNDFRTGLNTELSTGLPQPAGAASAVQQPLTLEPALGLEKGLSRLSPITRLQQSPFDTAKASVRDMADAGLSYRENWEGIPTSQGGTVETRTKMWNGPLYDAVARMDDAYARYFFGREQVGSFERRTAPLRAGWARITGQDGGRLTFQEFREEIGKAMARGDQHPIPQVAEAARTFRTRVIDPMWKRAQELKLAGEDAGPVEGFQTSKGSQYTINQDGTTTRNKAARPDPGHEGDSGVKPQSEKTYYADRSAASALGTPQGATWRIIDHGDGTISLATRNADGSWGISPSARNIAVSTDPDVGKIPIELWKSETVNGRPGYRSVHFGNEISSVRRAASEVVGAESYITRLYNREMIVARRPEWNNVLETHFREARDGHAATLTREGKPLDSFAQMDENAIKELVTSVTNKILGESAQRLASLSLTGKDANPLAKRVLTVPDEKLEPFLIRDIEKVARAYTRSLAPDIELTAKFGDVTMKEQLQKLQDEFNAKVNDLTSEKQRTALENQYKRAAADLGATRDRIRNVYAAPANPDGLLHRAGKLALNLNYVARLGGMTISSVPDIARPIMRYGINAFRDGWIPLVNNFGAVKLSAQEVKLAGTALDMVRDQRLMDIADLLDDYGRTSRFERGVQVLADKFGIVSLMSPWNGALKQLTGTITMAQVLRSTKAVAEGKASAKQINRLAQSGVDDAMARRIWAESEKTGTDVRGVFLPNTEDWADLGAVEAFRAVIVREVDSLIVTPGLEKPLWMSTGLGRIIGQFKSFAMASTQRTLLAGLQQRDAAALAGVMSALALGAVVAKVKATQRGEDTSTWTPGRWAAEAIDQSGLGGVLVEGANIADKWTGGKVGLARLSGKEVTRYQSRGAFGSLFGPTVDFGSNLAQGTRALSTGEVTRSDLHALRQVTPFQNLFYFRGLFDKIEEGVGDRLQLPAKRQR